MTDIEQLFSTLPSRVNQAAARGLRLSFYFRLSGENGGEYTVSLINGACTVTPGLVGQPRCVVEGSADDYVAMECGMLDPLTAYMEGRIHVSNLREMMQALRVFYRLR